MMREGQVANQRYKAQSEGTKFLMIFEVEVEVEVVMDWKYEFKQQPVEPDMSCALFHCDCFTDCLEFSSNGGDEQKDDLDKLSKRKPSLGKSAQNEMWRFF